MRRLIALTLTAAALGTAAPAAQPAHTQLIANLGLTEAEAAMLSTHQLVLLKHIKESPRLSEGDKRRRIKAILKRSSGRAQTSNGEIQHGVLQVDPERQGHRAAIGNEKPRVVVHQKRHRRSPRARWR